MFKYNSISISTNKKIIRLTLIICYEVMVVSSYGDFYDYQVCS